jgi:hypothetical protein
VRSADDDPELYESEVYGHAKIQNKDTWGNAGAGAYRAWIQSAQLRPPWNPDRPVAIAVDKDDGSLAAAEGAGPGNQTAATCSLREESDPPAAHLSNPTLAAAMAAKAAAGKGRRTPTPLATRKAVLARETAPMLPVHLGQTPPLPTRQAATTVEAPAEAQASLP